MFIEYQTELGIDLCFQGFEEELETLPGRYSTPGGALYVYESEGKPVAIGGLRDIGEGCCELKRMYVRPEARGKGLGKDLTLRLMDRAALLGYQRIRLDTLKRLGPALKMYESLGFNRIQPYNFNPELDIVYLELGISRESLLA